MPKGNRAVQLNPLLVFLFVTEASSPRFLSFYYCCRDSLGERHETRNATAAKTPDRRAGGKLLILRRQRTLNRDTNLTGCDPAFEYCTAREGMSESTVRRHGGGGQCAHSMGVCVNYGFVHVRNDSDAYLCLIVITLMLGVSTSQSLMVCARVCVTIGIVSKREGHSNVAKRTRANADSICNGATF